MSCNSEITPPVLDHNDMENIDLHRAESMVNTEIVIPIKINDEKPKILTVSVTNYIGLSARPYFSAIKGMKVEVVMFLYMFSYIIRSISSTSMLIDKVCLVHLNESKEICSNLEDKSNFELKKIVEKMANNYHLGHSLIQMVPSAILSLFIGAWSDKYSRKIPIIMALIGIIIDDFGTTLCAHFLMSRIEYYYIPALFTGISGGFISVLTVLYSYASDVSTSSNRTMKYAFMEMAFGLSMPLGALAGGWIFKFFGYVPVFLTATCGHTSCLIWVLFILEETRGFDCDERWGQKFRNFWTLDSVVSSFKATIKRRPNRGREQIWGLIIAMSVVVFSFASIQGIGYLYVHHQYGWDNTTYSTVSAIFSILGIIIMLIIVPLSRKYDVRDGTLGIAGSISLCLKNTGIGLAYRRGVYMLANLLGLLTSLGTLAGRSRISKVASKEDLGKVFAFLTTAETTLPILATAIISQGFNASLDFFPGLIFVVMGVLTIVPIGVFVCIRFLPNVNYEEMSKNADVQNDSADVSSPAINTIEK